MHTSKKRIYGEARFSRWLEFQEERRERRKYFLEYGLVSAAEKSVIVAKGGTFSKAWDHL